MNDDVYFDDAEEHHHHHDHFKLIEHKPSVNELAHEYGFLSEDDGVGISFWIISIAMVATTVFLLWEAGRIANHLKTSIHCGALVTLVAAVHYFYMREFWVKIHATPIVYRYIDWMITVPLQMVEFYLVLDGASRVTGARPPADMFWRLLLGTVFMLGMGYCGETAALPAWPAFLAGIAGWFYILFEVHQGEAKTFRDSFMGNNDAICEAYDSMKFIVTVGWSIYPLGYLFGYLMGSVSEVDLNLIYNLADFINKIAFVLSVWAAASEASK